MCSLRNNIRQHTPHHATPHRTRPHRIGIHWVIKGAFYFTIHCVISFYSAFMIVLSASMNISIWRTIEEQALKTQSPIATPMEHVWKYSGRKRDSIVSEQFVFFKEEEEEKEKQRQRIKKTQIEELRANYRAQSESTVSIRKPIKFERSFPSASGVSKTNIIESKMKRKSNAEKWIWYLLLCQNHWRLKMWNS